MSALIVLALAGTLGYLDVASTAGVRDALAGSAPASRVLQVQTRLADDADEQRTGADAVIASLLPADAVSWTTIRTPPLPLQDSANRLVMVVDDAITEFATLTDGSWSAGPGEAVLHAGAAQTLGIAVGDTLVVTSDDTASEVTVSGLWLPDDLDDTHWANDLSVTTGTDPLNTDSYGPLVVDDEALAPLSIAPFVQWNVTPGSDLAPDTIERWLAGLGSLAETLDDEGLTVRGVTTAGTLPITLADAQESLASVRASSAIPLLIVALVSLVALWQIARLLAAIRERETLVLLSRGASPRQLVGVGAGEAALIASGALVGAAAVLAVFWGRAGFQPAAVLIVTGAIVAVVVGVLVAVVARAALTGLHPAGESGRANAVLTGGALVLVLALASFSLWRFTRNGSPLIPGTDQTDVVAVTGPAFGLIAVALVAVAVAGPLSRGLAAAAARGRGFSPVTELRQSARRIAVNAVPVILVVLATATATLASGYAGTWQALRTTSAQVSLGADVRVDTAGGIVAGRPAGVAAIAAAAGGADATGVLQAAMRLDDRAGQLTAFPMAAAGVSSAPASLLDPAVAALTPPQEPLPGISLPEDGSTITFDVTASAAGAIGDLTGQRDVRLRAWLAQGSDLVALDLGRLRLTAAGSYVFDPVLEESIAVDDPAAGAPVSAQLEADLPSGTWRLVAVDSLMSTSYNPTAWSVTVDAITVDGAEVLANSPVTWEPDVLAMPGEAGGYTSAGPMAFTGTFAGEPDARGTLPLSTTQRFMPPGDLAAVPVVTTAGWGDQIRPGGTDVLVGAATVRVEQVGTIPVIPGNPAQAAALADLGSVQNALLRTTDQIPAVTQVWLDSGSESPHALASELRTALGPTTAVAATGESVTDAVAAPARIVYWAAAGCALLLALPAIVAVALTQAGSRRGEVVVLRAVGVSAAAQGRSRTRELLGLEIGAVVAGVLAGWLLSRVVMVDLIRSTTPQISRAVPLALTFDWLPGAALVGLTLLTVAAVALWYGARVRSQARDTTWREEIR